MSARSSSAASSTRKRRLRQTFVVGALSLFASIVALVLGAANGVDGYDLDLHFQWAGSIRPHPGLVVVHLDDAALNHVEPWPWNRRTVADLVRTLSRLGVKAIVLDILFTEPKAPRVEHAGLRLDYDLDSSTERGDRRLDPIIYDDDELAAAIREAGNVYLAMSCSFQGVFDTPRGSRDENESLPSRGSPIGDSLDDPDGLLVASLLQLLRNNFALTEDQLRLGGAAVGMEDERFYGAFVRAKRRAAHDMAWREVAMGSCASWSEFRDRVVASTQGELSPADRDDLLRAYRWGAAAKQIRARCLPANPSLLGLPLPRVVQALFPLEKLASSAKGVGFVSFDRSTGAIVRSLPPVAWLGDRLIWQLGALAAVTEDDLIPVRGVATTATSPAILAFAKERRYLPLLADGDAVVHWLVPRQNPHEGGFDSIPASTVMQLPMSERSRERNLLRVAESMGALIALRHQDTPAEFNRYVDCLQRRKLGDNSAETEAIQIETEAREWLGYAWMHWKDEPPKDDGERMQKRQLAELAADWAGDRLPNAAIATNREMVEQEKAVAERLQDRLRGKMCFVGVTATAAADFVPTPVSDLTPGVLAHANVANMILQQRPIFIAAIWARGLILVPFLVLIAGAAGVRSPLQGVCILALSVMLCVALGAIAFRFLGMHIGAMFLSMCGGGCWGVVTVVRQLTDERERRGLRRILAQYTSPALAARAVESIDAASFAPAPATVTCLFADLVGFTPMSSRLGPHRTRIVLNAYLAEASRIIHENGGLVNKFMGDGLFAFFNAPVMPCVAHAEAACRSAVLMMESVNRLSKQFAEMLQGATLSARVGLSTGDCFVGDYGSGAKLDYTCIGDAVNLGSRIEQANKVLGTTILADRATRDAVVPALRFRYLGQFALQGFAAPTPLFEVCGLGSASATDADRILSWEQAVEIAESGDHISAAAMLHEHVRHWPDDGAARSRLTRMENSSNRIDAFGSI